MANANLERLIRELEDDMLRLKTADECGKMMLDLKGSRRIISQMKSLAEIVRKLDGS